MRRKVRAPGPTISFDGVLRAELKNRVKGARVAWRSMGRAWHMRLPCNLHRVFFFCVVHRSDRWPRCVYAAAGIHRPAWLGAGSAPQVSHERLRGKRICRRTWSLPNSE
eukprot:7466492-Pyramimonas_sp.AAC.1